MRIHILSLLSQIVHWLMNWDCHVVACSSTTPYGHILESMHTLFLHDAWFQCCTGRSFYASQTPQVWIRSWIPFQTQCGKALTASLSNNLELSLLTLIPFLEVVLAINVGDKFQRTICSSTMLVKVCFLMISIPHPRLSIPARLTYRLTRANLRSHC